MSERVPIDPPIRAGWLKLSWMAGAVLWLGIAMASAAGWFPIGTTEVRSGSPGNEW